MALLWSNKKNLKPVNQLGNPSPTIKRYLNDFAQKLLCFIKGTSLFAAFQTKIGAGMTVEAAIALPIFLLFFLNLASLMEMMRLHGNLQFALWETGNEAALYECVVGDEEAAALLSAFYIRNRMIETLGSEYLEQSPLENGTAELVVLTNPVEASEDILDVTVSYRVAPVSGFIGFPSFRMSNYYYAHLWNGYELPGTVKESRIVYVTENGTVYHKDRNCTHLLLSIEQVDAEAVGKMRNQWGRAYGPCEKCSRGGMPDRVYITSEGECYHYSTGCAGLKRTVFALTLTEAQERYRSCSRCGEK